MPTPIQPFADNENAPPDPVVAFATRLLSGCIEPGFGYGSWVFMGRDTVLKIDPVRDRRGVFKCDSVADGLDLAGIATPEILDLGEIEGHEWIEISRIPGSPAYLAWLDYPEETRRRFVQRLRDALAEWRQIVPAAGLVKSAAEGLFAPGSAHEKLALSRPYMPGEYVELAQAALERSEAVDDGQSARPNVLVMVTSGLAI